MTEKLEKQTGKIFASTNRKFDISDKYYFGVSLLCDDGYSRLLLNCVSRLTQAGDAEDFLLDNRGDYF